MFFILTSMFFYNYGNDMACFRDMSRDMSDWVRPLSSNTLKETATRFRLQCGRFVAYIGALSNIRSSGETAFQQFVSLWVMNKAARHSRHLTKVMTRLQIIALDVPQ